MPHVTFIHGIANKPPREELLTVWRGTLADHGLDLGDRGVSSSMVYWADLLYPRPLAAGSFEAADTELSSDAVPDIGLRWALTSSGEEAEFLADLAGAIGFEELASDAAALPTPGDLPPDAFAASAPETATGLERVPIPWFLKRRLMKILLRDVHHYLFDASFSPRPSETYAIRTVIRERTVAALTEGAKLGGPHIVVAHSLGTVIAYDCLKRVPACPPVDGLLTVGSPLGLDEVQDKLKPEWSRDDGFPAKAGARWANVYDHLDPVAAFDPKLANDFRRACTPAIADIHEPSEGAWRHSIVKYLRGPQLRAELAGMLDLAPG